ncbi:MAG: hypothetical protein CVU38_04250 [Chloroflexi bacterium HGW-Chloroflexi-1]|nr:MAG: hypothetical protein CVU38_04250 [Chloroflexi bacterium HGW-Chloroflexi-1]
MTSLACLFAYTIFTLQIQSRFFGYLTGAAAGSAVMASIEQFHQASGLSRDWYTAGLSALAVAMLLAATGISRHPDPKRWKVFVDPFRYLALLLPAVLMPLTLGLRLVTRQTYDALHYAMTIDWFLGGFIFAWGAIRYRSRGLGVLAAAALPISIYMAQLAAFDLAGIKFAWHAFGLSLLTPLYLLTGHKLRSSQDEVLRAHGRTAAGWGVALIVVSALFSLTDLTSGAAAAATYTVLTASAALGAALWERPRSLYAASFFSFAAVTFSMTELSLSPEQLGVGWASLAILHIVLAILLATPTAAVSLRAAGRVGGVLPPYRDPAAKQSRLPQSPRVRGDCFDGTVRRLAMTPAFLSPIVTAGFLIAAAAILPPLFLYNGQLLAYSLGNWLALSGWAAYLAHRGQPGFVRLHAAETRLPPFVDRLLITSSIYHWLIALPLPVWLWVVCKNYELPENILPLVLAALAWAMVFMGHRMSCLHRDFRMPWRFTGLLVSLVAILSAFIITPQGFVPPITLLAVGLLYFADTLASRQSAEFYPAGLVTAFGLWLLLDRWQVNSEAITFGLCLLVGVYFLSGLLAERRRTVLASPSFLAPLYHCAHLVAVWTLFRVYARPLQDLFGSPDWTVAVQTWGAVDQLILAALYGLFAWGRYQERWGHIAAWLGMIGGGFIVISYSHGHGSLAATAAVIVTIFILAERALHATRRPKNITSVIQRLPHSLAVVAEAAANKMRLPAYARLAWRLFRRPLLVTGWIGSVGVILLALIRNLVWLGGGRIQQIWAAAGLLIITALYALSARLFRKARFVWFAAILIFIPWTLLTNLGWFTPWRFTLPGFAASWVVLAWVLFLINLLLQRRVQPAYGTPLKTVAHVLLPFSMLWAVADSDASRYTLGLSIALYGVSAWLNHRQAAREDPTTVSSSAVTKFFYPALGLLPVWCVYWLAFLQPAARHEHFGLLILAFGALGIATGKGLERLAPRPELVRAYGLPAYLTAYVSLIVGTLLTAHIPGLLAMVLLYDAILLAASAWIFKSALWVYPASGLAALSMLVALGESGIPVERRGWWLLGLAAAYPAIAFLLRRVKLTAYGTACLAVGFVLIALSLPPSSQDQIGALWGYAGAALLYAVSAVWLRQPLLLTPACVLVIVPYAVAIQRSNIPPAYHGMALLPGALLALGLGWLLDNRLGAWKDFPWGTPIQWLSAITKRLLHWWALPLYVLGLGLATFAPVFADSHAGLTALNLALLVLLYTWALFRFRRRFWLVTAALAGHLAAGYLIDQLGWWDFPLRALFHASGEAWLRYLPVTAVTIALALGIEKYFKEGSPLQAGKTFAGWSRPLVLFALFDLALVQIDNFGGTLPETTITLVHALMVAVLASAWVSRRVTYASLLLGSVALLQWRAAENLPVRNLPIYFAALALGYGLIGFGYQLYWRHTGPGPERTADDGPALRLGSGQAWLTVWMRPLQQSAMGLSFLALGMMPILGIQMGTWTIMALFGLTFRQIVEVETVWMVIRTLSLIGLLYVAAASAWRRLRLGYLAVAMLLAAWFIYAYFINTWDSLRQLQWYAVPVGVYLLTTSTLEWRRGNRTLARWLDYSAMFLMMGALFWQTLEFGWWFALTLGAEGFAVFLWGIVRRLRRFFYAGMVGVLLAVTGQLINALQEVNQWITFGLIGLVLVVAAIIIERRLETIKAWQEVLETWE